METKPITMAAAPRYPAIALLLCWESLFISLSRWKHLAKLIMAWIASPYSLSRLSLAMLINGLGACLLRVRLFDPAMAL